MNSGFPSVLWITNGISQDGVRRPTHDRMKMASTCSSRSPPNVSLVAEYSRRRSSRISPPPMHAARSRGLSRRCRWRRRASSESDAGGTASTPGPPSEHPRRSGGSGSRGTSPRAAARTLEQAVAMSFDTRGHRLFGEVDPPADSGAIWLSSRAPSISARRLRRVCAGVTRRAIEAS